MIEAYETAIAALSTGTTQSYTLDTGQTRQTVTRQHVSSMQAALDSAYNRLVTLEARLNGAVVQERPAW